MQNSFDMQTLVFLVLAVFVAWKLRSVLGQKTGHEQPKDPFARRETPPMRPDQPQAPEKRDNVIRLLPALVMNETEGRELVRILAGVIRAFLTRDAKQGAAA